MPEPWFCAEDIADYLDVTKDTIFAWNAGKGTPAHKAGRLWKSPTNEVDRWVCSGRAGSGA